MWAATDNSLWTSSPASISIHAARVGSDFPCQDISVAGKQFQSTLPVWAATCALNSFCRPAFNISIHAARVGSDDAALYGDTEKMAISIPAARVASARQCYTHSTQIYNYTPRCPCGQRLLPLVTFVGGDGISIHAARVGSDIHLLEAGKMLPISIHAARVGSDRQGIQRRV